MRKPDRGNPDSPSAQTPTEKQDTVDQAQDLFERMAGEAARLSQGERTEAKSRGRAARLLLALTIAASLLAAATMFYGIYHFPDAPIRLTAGGYAGKGGSVRKQEDFESFLRWEKMMFVVFPSAFVFGFAFAITDRIQRRKDAGEGVS